MIRSNDREQVRYQGVEIVRHADGRTFSFACPRCPFRRPFGSEVGALTKAVEHMGDAHRVRVTLPPSVGA